MDKEAKLKKILSKYGDNISGPIDLLADEKPTKIFYLIADKLSYLMDNNPENVLSEKGINRRKKFNKVLKKLGPMFLSSKQIIENRKKLENPISNEEDKGIVLPDEPVIWAPTHGFKDDALSTILAADRNAFFLFGSLPQFYNTIDGITAWINGSILVNRKNKASKKASIEKCKYAIDKGADLIIYPEGRWNVTPNLFSLKLWPGIYRIAKEKNTKIVPVIHYKSEPQLKNKSNDIHTVIDDPIDVSNMTEEEALQNLREVYAYWTYLMMEKYGKTTREEELLGFNSSTELWEHKMEALDKTADRYDLEIESVATYVTKEERELLKAWKDIADIKNITKDNIQMVNEAKQKVKQIERNNFQGRF